MGLVGGFLRLKYNCKFSPFPSLPPSPPIYFFHSPSNSWSPFSLIVISCIYVYTHAFLNLTCSVCIMLPLCMFQSWPFGTRQSSGILFSWDDHFSHSQFSLVSCSSLGRDQAAWLSPSSLTGSWVSLLFNSHLGSFLAETLWTKFLMLIGDTMLEQSPWSSSSYNHSAPSLTMTPEPWVLEWPVDVSFGNGLLWVCLIY